MRVVLPQTVPGEADVVEGDGATSDSDDDDNSFFPGALFWEAGRYDQATARFAISRDTLKSYPESMKVFVERARRVNDTAALVRTAKEIICPNANICLCSGSSRITNRCRGL